MSAGVIAVIDNTIEKVEGLTAATRHGGTLRFKHVASVVDGGDLTDTRSNSRKFILVPTGARALTGFMGQDGELTSVEQTLDLTVAYPVSKRTLDVFKVICEDVDLIGRELMLTSSYDAVNTGLERRTVEGYALDLDEPGGTALLTVPVSVRYTPEF